MSQAIKACAYLGCKLPTAEPTAATGRPPVYCDEPAHTRESAFAERARLRKDGQLPDVDPGQRPASLTIDGVAQTLDSHVGALRELADRVEVAAATIAEQTAVDLELDALRASSTRPGPGRMASPPSRHGNLLGDAPPPPPGSRPVPSAIACGFGDVDADLVGDLALVDRTTGAISARLGKGDGTYGPEQGWGTFGRPNRRDRARRLDNFENDDDLISDTAYIVGRGPDGTLSVRYSNASTTHTGPTGGGAHQLTWPTNRTLALADIDGDGQADLWSVDPDTRRVLVTSGGIFGFCPSTRWGTVPAGVTTRVGDLVDNDGQADLVTYNPANGAVRVAKAGTDTLGTFQFRGTAPKGADAVIGDLNGERSSDLYFRVPDGTVTARRTTQAGGFGPPIALGTLPADYRLSTGYLTDDGLLSVVGSRIVRSDLMLRAIKRRRRLPRAMTRPSTVHITPQETR